MRNFLQPRPLPDGGVELSVDPERSTTSSAPTCPTTRRRRDRHADAPAAQTLARPARYLQAAVTPVSVQKPELFFTEPTVFQLSQHQEGAGHGVPRDHD